MLYENRKQYELSDHQIGLVHKELNLPVRLVYTREQVKKSKLNPVPDKPASINIPLKVNLRTVKGLTEYRYAENIVQDAKGNIKYTPHSFSFFGDALLTELDIEFIWFILFWCPYCKNNKLKPEQRKRPRFEIEDAVTKAEIEASQKRDITRVNTMIYDRDVGLSEEDLRKIAKAYFIPNVDDLTRAQVELTLESKIFTEERRKKEGFKRFLDMAKAKDQLETKGKIQTAVDREIMKYFPPRKMWMWLDENGKGSQEICRITGGKSPYEALHDWMGANEEFRNALDDHLKGQTVVEKIHKPVLGGEVEENK